MAKSGPHQPPVDTVRCQLAGGGGDTVLATPAHSSSVDEPPMLAVSLLDSEP